MVKAVIDGIDVSSRTLKCEVEFYVTATEYGSGEVSLGNTGLIRHDNHGERQIIQQPNGSGYAGKHAELLDGERRIHNTCFLVIEERINDPVPIKKNGGPAHG
jgi:hypothetical protein